MKEDHKKIRVNYTGLAGEERKRELKYKLEWHSVEHTSAKTHGPL